MSEVRQIRKIKSSQIRFILKGWTKFQIPGGLGRAVKVVHVSEFYQLVLNLLSYISSAFTYVLYFCAMCWRDFPPYWEETVGKWFFFLSCFFAVLILKISHSKKLYFLFSEIVHLRLDSFKCFSICVPCPFIRNVYCLSGYPANVSTSRTK